MFVDNAPRHRRATLVNVKLAFLPSNTTSMCQPMDQGIIQTMKLKFRAKQLQYTTDQLARDTTTTDSQILRTISVLDDTYWVGKVWELVEPASIQKCFTKAVFVYIQPVTNSHVIHLTTTKSLCLCCGYPMTCLVVNMRIFQV